MSNWISKRREQLGITQGDLAARLQIAGLDVTRATVSHWEKGRYHPPLHEPEGRRALSIALKMSIPSILTAAGFEISAKYGEDALKAAEIVEQLPEDQKRLAIGILEQILRGV